MIHQPGEILQQRYQILGCLGKGGTGITYRAKDQKTQKQVAIKTLILRQAESWKAIELFEREAEILQRLNHPNIPKYLNYFVIDRKHDRSFYLVQELANGQSLFDWVQKGGRCTEVEINAIALQVLNILDYLHQLNPPVFHRDLKPQNLIRRADGQIFLVDFGSVGSTYHNTLMRGSTVVGTYGYMAPEQFRGQVVAGTDLYGLGATLLFLLTRRSPTELPVHKLKIDFRSQLQLSNHFADWLEKLLEPATKDRFSSAQTAIAELQNPATQYSQKKLATAIAATGLSILLLSAFADHQRYRVVNLLGLTQSAYNAIGLRELTFEAYLNKGGSPNAKDSAGRTLVYYAIGDLEKLKSVLAKGGRLQVVDRLGQSPLHSAAQGKPDVLEYLLSLNRIDINLKDKAGKTALSYVSSEENAQIFVSYINRRSLPEDQKQQLLQTLVQQATEQGWLSFAHNLSGNVPIDDSALFDITRKALEARNPAIFRTMITNKEKLSPETFRQIHFYQLALAYLTPQEIFQLIPHINVMDQGGDTLLNFLSGRVESNNDVQVIWQLIRLGANVNQPNSKGETPLLGCLSFGGVVGMEQAREEVAIALIQQSDLNYRAPGDRVTQLTELMFADERPRIRQELLKRGAK
ncbi:protein kinase [Pseudanabaenaceae cyanobacterium LEGE 13415]|nr:protein kinase [Pseudanabaenaceae cyanobacterium LEGE 13415]